MAVVRRGVSSGRAAGTRYRANIAHVRQSRPDPGLGLLVKFIKIFQVVAYSVGGGSEKQLRVRK